MDPGVQPYKLKTLTQVKEMLIARFNPIIKVTHAHGGQYKYSGHTICFPQDIKTIAKYLPHKIANLDVLVVHRTNSKGEHYDCYVSRACVWAALK